MLPGLKTFLLQRFHPDKHPEADEQQRRAFTEAMQAIFAVVAKGFQDANLSSARRSTAKLQRSRQLTRLCSSEWTH